MDVRVYRYGLLPPEQAALVHEQMWKAHRYRNELVTIERARRAAVRAVLARFGDLGALEVAFKGAEECLRVAKLTARSERIQLERRQNSPAVTQLVTEARTACSIARRRIMEARRASRQDPAAVRELGLIDEKGGELRRAARELASKDGLYWGTYQLIEEAMQQASRAPLYSGLDPHDPRYQRWSGEGQVSVQIMKGMSLAQLASNTDRRARLEHVVDRRADRDRFRILHLRVASNERDPVWASFPLKMHQPLPVDAVIKRVTVDLKRRGPKPEWSALFVIEQPTSNRKPAPNAKGAVAIDLGWRRRENGDLRVAVSFDGNDSRELRLPAYTVESFRKIEGLVAVRDQLFLRAVEHVQGIRSVAPAWFQERTSHVRQWRSEARMVSLVNQWAKERFAGDQIAFDALVTWRSTDRHLWWYESGAAINVHRRRREIYRRWAAELAQRYKVLVLEDFDLTEVVRRPPVGTDTQQGELARWQRRVAAISELRGALVNAFGARGGAVVKVNAAETTMTCSTCHVVEVFDAAARIRHTCANGHEWDQDENAARNIFERLGDDLIARSARKSENANDSAAPNETRWARARRLAAERKERLATSRETAV